MSGRVAAQIHDVLPAKVIVETMVKEASDIMIRNASLVNSKSKL